MNSGIWIDHKRPVYIFAFGEFTFHLVNIGGIQSFLAQLEALRLCKEILNAANTGSELDSPNANI